MNSNSTSCTTARRISLRRRSLRAVTLVVAASLLVPATGCGVMKKFAIATTADVFKSGMDSFYAETDYELAQVAGLGNLKLVEGLVAGDPENIDAALLASQAYAGYAFGFVEDEIDAYEVDEPEKAEKALLRALEFYRRAQKYANQAMTLRNKEWPQLFAGDFERFEAYLKNETTKDDVPALFWFAFGLGGRVNLGRDADPGLLADLPKVKAIMERLAVLDESYFHGGPRLFLGTMYAGLPQALGGDPAKGKEAFLRALELTDGKFMTARVFYAEQYAVAVQDSALFKEQLRIVLEAPVDVMAGQELTTIMAKRRAERLMARGEEMFETWSAESEAGGGV